MAISTYISENLTHAQMSVMRFIDENEMDIFSLEDIKELLGDESENINEIIENLVHKKFLSRIERGKYCRVNFRGEKVIGCFLVSDGAVAYWSALNLHGLTEQFPNTVFVQTTHMKKGKSVFGVAYHFVKIKKTKQSGIETQGVGSYKFRITDKEKTIVDCFDIPQYSGGYSELIRAFSIADVDQDKMIRYCKDIGNISVIKRLGFLTELLKKAKMSRFLKFAETAVNPRYVLLDPFGQEKGVFINKWKLRLNISKEELFEICNKQY